MHRFFRDRLPLLNHPIVKLVIYIFGEICVEHIYRVIVGTIWGEFNFRTNAFLDVWVGECCFFSAALTMILLMIRYFPVVIFSPYRVSVASVIVGGFAGFLVGLFLKAIQIRFLEHFHYYSYYMATSKSEFPFKDEVIYCFLVAVTEETAFRSYLFPILEKFYGTGNALVTTSMIFALGHLTNVDALTTFKNTFYTLSVTFSAGLLFASCLVLTRRMWMPIALHFSLDFFHSLSYGDTSVGVLPLGNLEFSANKVNQSSIIFYGITCLMLLVFSVRKGRWKKMPTR